MNVETFYSVQSSRNEQNIVFSKNTTTKLWPNSFCEGHMYGHFVFYHQETWFVVTSSWDIIFWIVHVFSAYHRGFRIIVRLNRAVLSTTKVWFIWFVFYLLYVDHLKSFANFKFDLLDFFSVHRKLKSMIVHWWDVFRFAWNPSLFTFPRSWFCCWHFPRQIQFWESVTFSC